MQGWQYGKGLNISANKISLTKGQSSERDYSLSNHLLIYSMLKGWVGRKYTEKQILKNIRTPMNICILPFF